MLFFFRARKTASLTPEGICDTVISFSLMPYSTELLLFKQGKVTRNLFL